MDIVLDLIISIFSFLGNNSLFDIPLLGWFIMPVLIGLIMKFIQGKR